MVLKYTPNTLKKLEEILKDSGYTVRSGKGNFNTGYCILESKKVVVVNKYHSMEARINAMGEIITKLKIDEEELSDSSKSLYEFLLKEFASRKEEQAELEFGSSEEQKPE